MIPYATVRSSQMNSPRIGIRCISRLPSVRLLINPALNTQYDNVWGFGLHTRLTF